MMPPTDPRRALIEAESAALVAEARPLIAQASAATCSCGVPDTGIWLHESGCIIGRLTGFALRSAAHVQYLAALLPAGTETVLCACGHEERHHWRAKGCAGADTSWCGCRTFTPATIRVTYERPYTEEER